MSTQEIRDIYSKVEIRRNQISKEVQELLAKGMESQLTSVFKKYYELLQNPKISVAVIDEAKRDMTKMLDIVVMDSDHDVIMALTNSVIEKKYKERIFKA